MSVNLKKIKRQVNNYKKKNSGGRALLIIDNGEDVIFNMGGEKMGVWKGTKTSEMARDHEGRRLLKWMMGKDFGDEALEIIQFQLDEVYQ